MDPQDRIADRGSDTPIRWIRLGDEDLRSLEEAARDAARARPWLRAAWLFGSAARGARPARDVDVGLLVSELPSPATLVALAVELAEHLGLPPDLVDLRIVNDADPVFYGRFFRDARRLFEADPAERATFEARAVSSWLDFQPAWERIRDAAFAGWTRG